MLDTNKKIWRWGPISGCPLFMHYTMLPSFVPMKKLLGVSYPESYVIFQNNKVTWVMDDENLSQHSQQFIAEVIPNKEKLNHYRKIWNERTAELQNYLNKIDQSNLIEMTNEEFIKLFTDFSEKYYSWWTLTMSIELISTAGEPRLGTLLKSYFPEEHPKEFNEAFALLSSPLTLTFYRQEERDLLHIATLPKDKQKTALQSHQQKYYWIYNSYLEAKVIDEFFFSEELKKAKNIDVQKAIEEIDLYVQKIVNDKDNLLNKIHASSELRWFVTLVETTAQLQDERKAINFLCDHYLEKFVAEFAKRTKKTREEIKLHLPEELKKVFINKNNLKMDQRKQCLVFHYDNDVEEKIEGSSAELLSEQLQAAKNIEASNIHGMLACSGDQIYFRGTAKIVRTINEMDKIEDGDILITTMTSPDFVIGMKKAGAIITDEGGMLCHAAVVSRELKKPCIVGTKISTKIIKDGDVVELHCGRGTVKVIKHKENN